MLRCSSSASHSAGASLPRERTVGGIRSSRSVWSDRVGGAVVGALRLYAHLDRLVPAAARAIGGLQSWPRVMSIILGEAVSSLSRARSSSG